MKQASQELDRVLRGRQPDQPDSRPRPDRVATRATTIVTTFNQKYIAGEAGGADQLLNKSQGLTSVDNQNLYPALAASIQQQVN